MKLNRKLMMILAIVLSVAIAVGGTMAYLQDTDEDVNVMTLGSVYITQNEQQRNENGELVPFENEKPMYPAVYDGNGLVYQPKEEWPVPGDDAWMMLEENENVIDKIVTVTNTGKSDAYVRTLIAFEGIGVYGVNGGDNAFIKYLWCGSEVGDQIAAAYEGEIKVDGVDYTVISFTYKNALAPGETTIPSLKQLYLSKEAGNAEMEYYGEYYDVLALSQAVQTQGFEDAQTALDTAFGKANDKDNLVEWFSNVGDNVGTPGDKWPNNNPPSAFTGDPAELKKTLTEATDAGSGNVTIELTESYDMTGFDWTPIKVDGYHGADIVTIEGNGNYIKGLSAPLFAGGFAGGSGIVISDLTIMDSDIVSQNTLGSGAFVESIDSMAKISLDNCHLLNSTVTGGAGSRTGGLIGWTAGYNNQNDGPVKTYVEIRNCSVIDCEITCDGSVGGIYGHAGNNAWTYSTIENCTVKNCKLNSTDDGGWRVGVVVGTANVGEVTINNITESGNTLTQTGKTAPEGQSNLYGRFVPGTTGKLVIDGTEIN